MWISLSFFLDVRHARRRRKHIQNCRFSRRFPHTRFQMELLCNNIFSPTARQPLVVRASSLSRLQRSHSGTPHSVRLLWTSDRTDARDPYLTTHNTHKRQRSMSTAGLEPAIPASGRPQTHALERAAFGFGIRQHTIRK